MVHDALQACSYVGDNEYHLSVTLSTRGLTISSIGENELRIGELVW